VQLRWRPGHRSPPLLSRDKHDPDCGVERSGLQLSQVNLPNLIIIASVRVQRNPALLSFLGLKKVKVFSSLGKIDVVAPSSAPILVMVALSGTVKLFTPGPPYFESLGHSSFHGEVTKHLENDILCADPGRSLSPPVSLRHLRTGCKKAPLPWLMRRPAPTPTLNIHSSAGRSVAIRSKRVAPGAQTFPNGPGQIPFPGLEK